MVNIDMEIAKWIALLWAQRSGVTISSRNYQLRVLIVTELLRCYDDNIWNNVFVISYNYNFLQELFFPPSLRNISSSRMKHVYCIFYKRFWNFIIGNEYYKTAN